MVLSIGDALKEEVISGKGNFGGSRASENFIVCCNCVCLGVYCDGWEGIIELHVQFCEFPHVAYGFYPLVQSI